MAMTAANFEKAFPSTKNSPARVLATSWIKAKQPAVQKEWLPNHMVTRTAASSDDRVRASISKLHVGPAVAITCMSRRQLFVSRS
eukprot:CAMPEP_0180580954 /NCGR_PEP_ID=MMETSP1037_2-20121125/13800_1 /TAXON_ID=632150 /ORGANISM="Azadinium spinosum, Strain 3D9" /LENGTH=84 /DNA_ID=CAMNT_0022598917 /DNA_START=250 /DNA_END=504 /DNA_ORIENTATION=-